MSQQRALSALGIVLVISLIANALLVGLWIGNTVGRGSSTPAERGPRGGGEDAVIARALESVLPDGARQDMRAAFRKGLREAAPYMREKHRARQQLKDALGADPFDPAALQQAFEDIRAADEQLTRSFHAVLSEELATLSPDQRAELVAWMDRMEARRRAWHGRFGEEGHGPRGHHNGPPPPLDDQPD
ncbi:periplasmic heavy metal sensor [Henriciella mobilis]|uniref:Periplasmic heavy metal sensor n=1 Tax=Henriciella mobilis TaxID=2305467 RepID=A0A399RFT1_9PROT|nr:periplasmic heavy metal sensor [Henriciella mobilis]RIJ28479.1 periplasmic heavy metal sensor [Henriciella mobilis]